MLLFGFISDHRLVNFEFHHAVIDSLFVLAEEIAHYCFTFSAFFEHRLSISAFALSFLFLTDNFLNICLAPSFKSIEDYLQILVQWFLLFQPPQYFLQLSSGLALDIVEIQLGEERSKFGIDSFHLMLFFNNYKGEISQLKSG